MPTIQLPIETIGKSLKLGQMTTGRFFIQSRQRFETAFIIKDNAKKLQEIANTPYASARCFLNTDDKAIALIFIAAFGSNNKYLYDYWFNHHLVVGNTFELLDLATQDKATYILMNEKNQVVDLIITENILFGISKSYIYFAEEVKKWSVKDFEVLKRNVQKDFKSIQNLWKHIGENMNSKEQFFTYAGGLRDDI